MTSYLLRISSSWLLRLYVALSVIISCYISWGDSRSLLSTAIAGAGPLGWPCIYAMCGVAAVIVMDVVVNDLLPHKWKFQTAKNNRHILYMLLSLALMSTALLVARTHDYTPLLWRYGLDAVISVVIAFTDLFERHRHRAERVVP